MYINSDNMIKIIKNLDKFFTQYDITEMATIEYPKKIKYRSNEWLYYIFYSCLLNYGMHSNIYHSNLIDTYQNHEYIFDPNYVVNNFSSDASKLHLLIRENIHPRYPNVAVDKWIKLSKHLTKYDNLLDYIKSFKTFEELELFIKSINGYGQKTGGLLLRLICEANICTFPDKISSIPLDRHDLEISYLTGIINTKNLTLEQIKELSDFYIKYSNKLSIDPIKVDKYLWELGSKFCNKRACQDCPLHSDCSTKIKGRKI